MVSPENFTIRARREGFPCGVYKVQVNNGNDSIGVYINGTQIFASACCINSSVVVGNTAGYALSTNDIVEVRLTGVCGGNEADVQLVPVTVAAINGGVIVDSTNMDLCLYRRTFRGVYQYHRSIRRNCRICQWRQFNLSMAGVGGWWPYLYQCSRGNLINLD